MRHVPLRFVLAVPALAALLGLAAGPTSAAPPSTTFVYVHDASSPPRVFGFVVEANGALTPAAGRTKPGLLDVDGGISVASTGLVAAFSGDGGSDTQTFRMSPKGKLKRLGAAQASGLAKVTSSAFSPDGTILVAASTASGAVTSYTADATTGVLTQSDSQAIPSAVNLNGVVVVHVQFADR